MKRRDSSGPSFAYCESPSFAGFPASPEGSLFTIGGRSPPDNAPPALPPRWRTTMPFHGFAVQSLRDCPASGG
jgi:hypothetical protein